jgi:transaldolase
MIRQAVLLFLIALASIQKSLPFSPPHRGTNRLFLDTAIQSEWEDLLPLGIFHGITTNPTLLERAGLECTIPAVQSLTKRALSMVGCDEFMCQAWGNTSEAMYNVGMRLSEVDRGKVVIKVPVTFEGTKAASKLIDSGVRVCLTACYSSDQAIVAAGLGAEYLAPYLGRMTDAGKDGMEECRRMQNIANGMGSSTRILVASIRDVTSMGDLMGHGMDTFTFNPDIARDLFSEVLTSAASEDFEAAAKRCGGDL